MITSRKEEDQMDFLNTTDCSEGGKLQGIDWLELPDDLLGVVFRKMNDVTDYVRSGAVCRLWKKVNSNNLHLYSPPCQPPMLMFSKELSNQDHSYFSVTGKSVSSFQLPISPDKRCIGSTKGWLVIVDMKSAEIMLYNPFLIVNNEIELPSLSVNGYSSDSDPEDTIIGGDCKCYHLCTTLLSGNPIMNSTIVFAIYGAYCRLGFCKLGNDIWASLGLFFYSYFDDVVYYKDQLYVVDKNGTVFSCDVTDPCPKVLMVAEAPYYPSRADRTYLVESNGDLLQVRKRVKNSRKVQFTVEFEG